MDKKGLSVKKHVSVLFDINAATIPDLVENITAMINTIQDFINWNLAQKVRLHRSHRHLEICRLSTGIFVHFSSDKGTFKQTGSFYEEVRGYYEMQPLEFIDAINILLHDLRLIEKIWNKKPSIWNLRVELRTDVEEKR